MSILSQGLEMYRLDCMDDLDVLKRRIRAHPAFLGGAPDESYWLDMLEVWLSIIGEECEFIAETLAATTERHPEKWGTYIVASQVDRLAWQILKVLLRRLRKRKPGSLAIPVEHETVWRNAWNRLNGWALDVATDVRVEPKPAGRDSRKQALRNATIVCVVNGIRDLGELPYASDERRSACHAVAERLGMKYYTIRSIWRRGQPLLTRARDHGLIPPKGRRTPSIS